MSTKVWTRGEDWSCGTPVSELGSVSRGLKSRVSVLLREPPKTGSATGGGLYGGAIVTTELAEPYVAAVSPAVRLR
jgi:hypothetical protein